MLKFLIFLFTIILIFLFTIILIFLFARRNQRFYIVRTIVLLIKYILVPLLIIYYISINYDFFYNEDTSLYTIVNYIANTSDTNYLSENILHNINFFVDNSTNSNLQKHNSTNVNLPKDSLINSNKTKGGLSESEIAEAKKITTIFIIVVSFILLVTWRGP